MTATPLQTKVLPVDLSEYADVRILNMANDHAVPTGYIILGVYPGQYVERVHITTQHPVFTPYSGGGGSHEMKSGFQDNPIAIATSFLLIGRPKENALYDLDQLVKQLRDEAAAAKKLKEEDDKKLKEKLDRLAYFESMKEVNEKAAAKNFESAAKSEALAVELRKQIMMLANHFGKKAVDEVLAPPGKA